MEQSKGLGQSPAGAGLFLSLNKHNALDQRRLKSDESWCAGTNLIATRRITCPLTASTATTTWQCIPTRKPPPKRPVLLAPLLPQKHNSAKPQPCGQPVAW